MREIEVVTCFLLRRGKRGDEVLLLRRSEQVGTYRGRWAGVSGYLDPSTLRQRSGQAGSRQRQALEQAYREIEEETGLSREDVRLLSEGEALEVVDESIGVRWTVHPFLFEVVRPQRVRLDWEHVEARWLPPQEVGGLETVPGLAEALERVYRRPA